MTRHALGWHPDTPHQADRFHPRPAPHAHLPPRVDLRPALPPAWTQGDIQSCTAHALAAALWVIRPVLVSRLALYWHARAVRGTIAYDSGAMLRHAIAGLQSGGIVAEPHWPYRPIPAGPRSKRFPRHAAPARRPPAGQAAEIAAFRLAQDLRALKSCLAEGYPVAFGFWAHASLWDAAHRPRRVMPVPRRREPRIGGHAVAAVGYCDGRRAFLIRNSWGPSVQERGHFWMPYRVVLNPRLAMDFWTIRGRK